MCVQMNKVYTRFVNQQHTRIHDHLLHLNVLFPTLSVRASELVDHYCSFNLNYPFKFHNNELHHTMSMQMVCVCIVEVYMKLLLLFMSLNLSNSSY